MRLEGDQLITQPEGETENQLVGDRAMGQERTRVAPPGQTSNQLFGRYRGTLSTSWSTLLGGPAGPGRGGKEGVFDQLAVGGRGERDV